MSSEPRHQSLAETWMKTSTRLFNSALEANRATLAAFGVPTVPTNGATATPDDEDVHALAGIDLDGWDVEVTADHRDALDIGDKVRFTKTISENDVIEFARASGDTNRLHLDKPYAEKTRFKGRIVHGTLAAGLISAALARLPGLVIYLSQDVEFRNPIRIGDRITAEVEIVEDLGDYRYRLSTVVTDDDDTIVDGEAVVLLDKRPDA
ncbi:MaoC family dehydratase [Haladaptatus sp. DJG-WS-42]|uniref:MaoC family dehydratase n=1 Tax=Haladaptatus sp. DJG-WS-42 TaxID=3120516 RepID=UPI0030D11B4E